MKSTELTEEQLRGFFIADKETRNVRIICEVPVFSRSVDLVISHMDGKITAIEFKLHDWNRALEQLMTVSFCFDYLEICLPSPRTERGKMNIINKCSDMGIGVYLFDNANFKFEHVLKPRKVAKIWDVQKNTILRICEEVMR